ncbi:cytochrome c [Novacetimonas cocois]|nr:cytochrome c [Novacetimonas cocois]
MKATFRRPAACLGGVAFLVAMGLAIQPADRAHAQTPVQADSALIEHGAYVAVLGDCMACHTVSGNTSYSGGLPLATPIGTIYSTNITPDRQTGIGSYSYEDFEQAVRHGIRKDGKTLYPAMPYPDFRHINDEDMHALYAFFMSGVKPVHHQDRAPAISWPLSMRWPLAWWRWMFVPSGEAPSAAVAHDALADRGAYLVEGAGHCGTCHTPRGFALEQKAFSPQDGSAYLAGSRIDHYTVSNLRGGDIVGLGSWNEDDIVRFLQSGRNQHAAVFGGMADVVYQSTQHMSEADLRAIAHFLKTLPPPADNRKFAYDPAVKQALFKGDVTKRGALDYLNNCAACHRSSGMGYEDTFPALAGNPVVNDPDPASLLHIVLTGATIPGTHVEPTHYTMPSFGDRLSDQEVADILTFIRSGWGNHASSIDAEQVGKFRKLIAPTNEKKTL